MPQTRKLVRDALVPALSDTATGFNAQMQDLSAVYGLTPYVVGSTVIDFSEGSKNFAQAYVTQGTFEELVAINPPAMFVYTSSSTNNPGDPILKSRSFSGAIIAHVDLYLKYRALHDADPTFSEPQIGNDLESLQECAEEAVMNAVNAYSWNGGVQYAGEFSCTKQPPTFFRDGYVVLVPIQLVFYVFSTT